MNLGNAIQTLMEYYQLGLHDLTIRKPISWALYKTWRYVDAKEKPRKTYEEQDK